MSFNSSNTLLRTETKYKENVYRTFDEKRSEANAAVKSNRRYVDSGAYEDQAAFMARSSLNESESRRHSVDRLIQKLYRKPYFSHIELREEGESEISHFYLSDCEQLDESVRIGNDGLLLPFKKDEKRPISTALRYWYQQRSGEAIRYTGNDGNEVVYWPVLICDDEIENRKLLNAMQLFPEQDFLNIDADELLAEKLQENRNNPELRNIISTLQQKQFQIIEKDLKTSFAVQGCAGSGKSQCLLHRLFFLRDELSQNGWEHILLLTPTQLFRNYSAELIQRYQLNDINNCSISELYRTLLFSYDPRFRNRQYLFELSEEYLPDEYLQVVYAEETIESIEQEIESAIHKYVQEGCSALGIQMPEEVTSSYIESLIDKLDTEMQAYDSREMILQQDSEYKSKKSQYEKLQKLMEATQKNYQHLLDESERIDTEENELNKLISNVKEAENERSEWKHHCEDKLSAVKTELSSLESRLADTFSFDVPAQYAHQLYVLRSVTSGTEYQKDEEHLKYLTEYYALAKQELSEVTKNQKLEKVMQRYKKRKEVISEKIKIISEEVEKYSQEIKDYAEWFREKASEFEGEKSRKAIQRSEMERAKYFLTRIESTVFEKEVWNALEPIKSKYNIKTLQVDALEEGRRRETRILYKSDLLFYLKIYAKIHSEENLPSYGLFCIDEGQDLHKADYDMLHLLYPKAVFNIFGDTDQVLHAACGIQDWITESGIQEVYPLNRNYRNTAAIVDFCNSRFGVSMEYIGKVIEHQKPKVIGNIGELKHTINTESTVIIVKNRQCFDLLCKKTGMSEEEFEYLDTHTEKVTGSKIPCYSIFAAKGLEFSKVLVYSEAMTKNQKVVACTRAMEMLYYYG